MGPADELRAAATRLDETVEPVAYTAPWTARDDDPWVDNAWTLAAPPPPDAPPGVSWHVADEMPEGTARWAALLGPQVAVPLAAWLRAEADCFEMVERLKGEVARVNGDEADESKRWRLPIYASSLDAALAFARVINGTTS